MNWDDTKYFLAVARAGQMLGAANRLGVSQAKLSRRISSLEEALNTTLFERSIGGCELTKDGRAMLEIAIKIEQEFATATTKLKGAEDDVSGTIRIGSTDGLGISYLSKRLHLLSERFPDLHIQLVPMLRSFSLSQREADIAIMVERPEKGRLRVRKLSEYSLALYASKAYLKSAPPLVNIQDLHNHRLIGYVEDMIFTQELNYNTEILENWRSNIEISSSIGQLMAVQSGAGIGILHDFMAQDYPDLIRLFPENQIERTFWTVWHESMKNTRRVAAVAQFLNEMAQTDRSLFMPRYHTKRIAD
jgi:DNA-binding transcriptional LysR family regulator